MIDVLTGPPGAGKTSRMIADMIAVPGLYLLAAPSCHLVRERADDLRRARPNLMLVELHSEARPRPHNVARAISEAADLYRAHAHVVLLVTHEGLTSADLSGFVGWHVRIDEVPDAVASGTLRIPAASRFCAAVWDLEPQEDTGWSRVVPRKDAPTISDYRADDVMGPMLVISRRAQQRGLYVDLEDWRDAEGGRVVQWWSAWSLDDLHAFESVVISGAGFFGSVLYRAVGGDMEFRRIEVEGRAPTAEVVIRYFAATHRGSTSYWSDGIGKRNIAAICRFLERDGVGYWSGNEIVTSYFQHRVPGEQVSPKVAGTNSLVRHETCAMIYSAKALPSDMPLISAFGLSPQDIEAGREAEDIYQFAMRGAIRTAGYEGCYTVYLYDRHQAEALAERMREAGVALSVSVEHVEGVIEDLPRVKAGRPAAASTETHEERQTRKREEAAERKRKSRAAKRATT